MTVSDTHADTIREALPLLSRFEHQPLCQSFFDNGGTPLPCNCIVAKTEAAIAALHALVAEIERERARADRAEAKLAATDEWVTKVSLQSTEAATYADRLAEAVRAWDADLSEYCDGPLRDEVRAALSAGSGGRETTP